MRPAFFRPAPLLLLSILAAFLPGAASAFESLPVHLEHFEDYSAAMTIEEVLLVRRTGEWKKIPENPHFGYSNSRHWFRFQIPEDRLVIGANEPLLLEIPFVYYSRIALYSTFHGKVLRKSETGMAVKVSTRGGNVLRTGLPISRIPAPRSPDAEYFISIEGEFPLALPLNLMEAPAFALYHWRAMMAHGMFLGLLLLAALFNGFLAYSLRSRIYLFYSLFVVFLTMLFLAHEGFTVQFFWPDSPWWALREMHVWGGFTLIFYALFVRDFLSTREITPWLNRLMFLLVGLSFARTLWLLIGPNQIVHVIGQTAVTCTNMLVLVISLVAISRGVRAARYFFAASAAFNLSMILFVLQEANLIWFGNFLRYAPHFGAAAEVVLLSFALADRIRQTKQELEDQRGAMILSDKLAALGRMAGEVAHEINNPLAIIHANAVLIREMAKSPSLAAAATTLEQNADRISRVVKGMRTLSRDCRHDPVASSSWHGIVQDSVTLCQEGYSKAGVELKVQEIDPGLSVDCRASDICRVVVNLLSNALDATTDAGAAAGAVTVTTEVKNGWIELAVEDGGAGIPPEHRKRLMEPFYTTKKPGKGLGLGLSISRTIVESHGGRLWLDETSPRTRFVFTIPLQA